VERRNPPLFEQFGVRPRADENNLFALLRASYAVDQDPITGDVTVPVIPPISLERMVVILGGERTRIPDEEPHDLL